MAVGGYEKIDAAGENVKKLRVSKIFRMSAENGQDDAAGRDIRTRLARPNSQAGRETGKNTCSLLS